MRVKKEYSVDIADKVLLSVDEANALTGIGINKIRRMINDPKCPFVLHLGGRSLIKRKRFEAFLEEKTDIQRYIGTFFTQKTTPSNYVKMRL